MINPVRLLAVAAAATAVSATAAFATTLTFDGIFDSRSDYDYYASPQTTISAPPGASWSLAIELDLGAPDYAYDGTYYDQVQWNDLDYTLIINDGTTTRVFDGDEKAYSYSNVNAVDYDAAYYSYDDYISMSVGGYDYSYDSVSQSYAYDGWNFSLTGYGEIYELSLGGLIAAFNDNPESIVASFYEDQNAYNYGTFTYDYAVSTSLSGSLQMMTISEVPAPAAAWLLLGGLGALGLARRRRS